MLNLKKKNFRLVNKWGDIGRVTEKNMYSFLLPSTRIPMRIVMQMRKRAKCAFECELHQWSGIK